MIATIFRLVALCIVTLGAWAKPACECAFGYYCVDGVSLLCPEAFHCEANTCYDPAVKKMKINDCPQGYICPVGAAVIQCQDVDFHGQAFMDACCNPWDADSDYHVYCKLRTDLGL
jgi:hypothetical protein